VVVAVAVVPALLMAVPAVAVGEPALNTRWMFQAFLPQLLLLVPLVVVVQIPGTAVTVAHLVGLVEELPTQEMVVVVVLARAAVRLGAQAEPRQTAQ
jgi:hypothetical protein